MKTQRELNIKRLSKFILDNKLSFNGTGSSLNMDCTVLSGFADYLGVLDHSSLLEAIKSRLAPPLGSGDSSTLPLELKEEVQTVFNFAYKYNYGNFWKTPEAKALYTF